MHKISTYCQTRLEHALWKRFFLSYNLEKYISHIYIVKFVIACIQNKLQC